MKKFITHSFAHLCCFLCLLTLFSASAESQWVQSGLSNRFSNAFASNSSNLYAGTDSGMFRSVDNGASWTDINSALPRVWDGVILTRGTDLFMGTAPNLGANVGSDIGDVYRSTNNGASWSKTNLAKGDVSALLMSGSNLFAGVDGIVSGTGGVYLSTNNGTSWTSASTGLVGTRVSALVAIGTSLFAGTDKGVSVSTNNGTTWDARGLTTALVSSFLVSGSNLFAGTSGHGIYLSTNNGANWNLARTGMPAATYVTSLAASGANLFAGAGDGVYISTNNGSSWSLINTGLSANAVGSVGPVAVSGLNLFLGSVGLWKRPLSDFGGSSVSARVAESLTIELSPNPTHGIVQVHGLPAGARVEVMNILGENVTNISGVGSSDRAVDLSSFSAGTYFIRISSAGSTTTKMVVKD